MTAGYTNPVCRGDWRLGNACGICERCVATKPEPPAPPAMRTSSTSLAPTIGSMLIVLVLLAGVAVGTKMSGGW